MTVKELKEYLANIPNDAEVLIEYGQNKERAESFVQSRSKNCDDTDDMIFEWDEWREYYGDEAVEEYDKNGKVTAVLISY